MNTTLASINTDIKSGFKSWVCKNTVSKKIELESFGCSGFKENLKRFKTWPTGTFQLNSKEVMCV